MNKSKEFLQQLAEQGYNSPPSADKAGDTVTEAEWEKARRYEQGECDDYLHEDLADTPHRYHSLNDILDGD